MPKRPSWNFFDRGSLVLKVGILLFLTYFAISPDSIKKIRKNPQILIFFLICLNKRNFPPKSQGVYLQKPISIKQRKSFLLQNSNIARNPLNKQNIYWHSRHFLSPLEYLSVSTEQNSSISYCQRRNIAVGLRYAKHVVQHAKRILPDAI